jgi:hypothetical protein
MKHEIYEFTVDGNLCGVRRRDNTCFIVNCRTRLGAVQICPYYEFIHGRCWLSDNAEKRFHCNNEDFVAIAEMLYNGLLSIPKKKRRSKRV